MDEQINEMVYIHTHSEIVFNHRKERSYFMGCKMYES